MANKVYSLVWSMDLIAGAVDTNQAYINNFNRQFILKSIFFDVKLKESVNQTLLPLGTNTVVEYNLDIVSQPGNTVIATAFENCLPAVNLNTNGTQISIYQPGQIFFNSFFMVNQLLFLFNITNRHAATSYRYYASCVVEIEEIKLKFAR